MGFFLAERKRKEKKKKEVEPKIKEVKVKQPIIPLLLQQGLTCSDCTLDREPLQHPKMKPTGSRRPLLYMLGEAPGETEDEEGVQFVGKSGSYIRDFIPKALYNYMRWNNVLRCRPPNNRAPTDHEMRCCSRLQRQDISETKPFIIMGFGNSPLEWALGQSGITRWRGMLTPVNIGGHRCWYAPLLHPAYVVRAQHSEENGKEIFVQYQRDLERVFNLAQRVLNGQGLDPPWVPEGKELDSGIVCELSYRLPEIEGWLEHLVELFPDQVVDIETSCLRPYSKDGRILSIAFGTWDSSYAIPLEHPEAKWSTKDLDRVYRLTEKHLFNNKVTFWAHNLKFEQEWLYNRLGADILFKPRWGDTMAQAYVLHNEREKSLEARSVALIGVDCKSLDHLDKDNMAKEPLDKVLKYNGRDCKFTDRVREFQQAEIKEEGLETAYEMMVSRVPTLVLAQAHGLVPDTVFAENKHKELEDQIKVIEKSIEQLKDVKRFVVDEGKPFNPNSNHQLSALMQRLNIREGWRRVNGQRKYSTDESVLSRVKHPLAKLVLELRTTKKLDGTYVTGFCPSKGAKYIYPDGLVHTNYNHLKTSTGRLSSEDPNEQNFPKRKNKEIRNVIKAPAGHVICAVDYGQIEARVIGIASGCPVLMKALWEHYDIHMDWILKISKAFPYVLDEYKPDNKTEEKIIRAYRQDFKSLWTFPLFFGSELEPVADAMNIPARKLKPFYEEFWERYKAVKTWQQKLIADYKQCGWVQTLTGRRRYGPITLNEAMNQPIQGTASDIVVDAMERLSLEAYKTGCWQLQPRMNIHDDLSFYLPTKTIEKDLQTIVRLMCQPSFDFINVPISVEVSIGEAWGELEEILTVESTEYGYPKVKAQRSRENREARNKPSITPQVQAH